MTEARPDTGPGDRVVAVVGAGPAGLSAAHELTRSGVRPLVFEAGSMVGGIARTEVYRGFRFDIGGHRYFTKSASIGHLWGQTLGDDLLDVDRLSRIHYNGRYFDYPLRLKNALANLGVMESARILASYLRARATPFRDEETFDQWVCNRFGRRLYRLFFKTYTEKVWGISCARIRSDWAAQRIRGLSLATAVAHALLGIQPARTLVHGFRYPILGSGMMWERLATDVSSAGGRVRLHARVDRLRHADGRIVSIGVSGNGPSEKIPVDHLISSMPVSRMVAAMSPAAPEPVLAAAAGLRHRSLMLVGLILNRKDVFPDQWIYVHDPDVGVGRIQNFANWSMSLSPDPNRTHLGLEYFCDENDAVWRLSDAQAIHMAAGELETLGLVRARDVSEGFVVRQPEAYPVYDEDYRRHLGKIRRYLAGFSNLQTIGRNGMHRYNNMDHSMRSGILAAQNALGAAHDLWALDDDGYLEDLAQPLVAPGESERITGQVFASLDAVAFGVAVGIVSGLLLLAATGWLVLKGGPTVGPTLRLLAQYFPGYSVTPAGAWVGLGYGCITGFAAGWTFAFLRNRFMAQYLVRIRAMAERSFLRGFFDHM